MSRKNWRERGIGGGESPAGRVRFGQAEIRERGRVNVRGGGQRSAHCGSEKGAKAETCHNCRRSRARVAARAISSMTTVNTTARMRPGQP